MIRSCNRGVWSRSPQSDDFYKSTLNNSSIHLPHLTTHFTKRRLLSSIFTTWILSSSNLHASFATRSTNLISSWTMDIFTIMTVGCCNVEIPSRVLSRSRIHVKLSTRKPGEWRSARKFLFLNHTGADLILRMGRVGVFFQSLSIRTHLDKAIMSQLEHSMLKDILVSKWLFVLERRMSGLSKPFF